MLLESTHHLLALFDLAPKDDLNFVIAYFVLYYVPKETFCSPDKYHLLAYSITELKSSQIGLLTLCCAHEYPSAGTRDYL